MLEVIKRLQRVVMIIKLLVDQVCKKIIEKFGKIFCFYPGFDIGDNDPA